ncbi:MAG: acetate kinase, partial [Firmicutes bacterium]|nr:acetate kinase [Bacillota bacterium]
MKVLVINCGSSSLKYQVLNMEDESLLCKGLVEKIGIDGSMLTHSKVGADKFVVEQPMKDHTDAIQLVLDALVDKDHGVLASMDELQAVGHRVLHGGDKFTASIVVDEKVKETIRECFPLGPLHNPANLMGIEACEKLMPHTPQVAVFDTAFHQTMPAKSFMYALPYEYYEKHSVRKYGFHGTYHRYIAQTAAKMLGSETGEGLKIISCHLGNGASLAAIKDGKVYDTSMGLTPLEGLIMGTRCGDIDPAAVPFIAEKEGLTMKEMDTVMNKKSGILGISGVSSDFRDVEAAADAGNERAQLALDMFVQRVKHYIGAYAAEMGGVDAIVFTAGLGENGKTTRAAICKDMEFLGIKMCDKCNDVRGKEAFLNTADSKVKLLLIPTNEELMIARDTLE